jgi:hypothetical protein
MCRRLREQARSHKKHSAIPRVHALPTSRSGDGSQLKRRTLWERACSRKRYVSHIDVGCAAVFASKLAPTGISSFSCHGVLINILFLLVFSAGYSGKPRNLF